MKHFKRDMSMILTGLALGALLTGGAVAAGITAEPAWSPIYVDGQQVQMEAYNINGNNYVKLRDIGKAMDFNVYWANGVQVDSTAPYTGEALVQTSQPSAAQTIRVGSYKGNTLKVGDRSGLIIGPARGNYIVSSSDPSVVTVEQIADNWVAVAKAPGSATITVSNNSGGMGSLALAVESVAPGQTAGSSIDLTANMEIRREMIRLINQVRQENGVAELPINEAVMNATQDISTKCRTSHGSHEWEILQAYGWPHGGANNLTCFSLNGNENIAQRAVRNWVNSRYHFQTMLCEEATCLGVGVTIKGDMAYCHMFVGDPNSHGPL